MIFNPFSPIPVNPKSHVRGWALHWAECMSVPVADKVTDLSTADNLFMEHGVNFSGGLNLFGGVTDDVVERIEQVANFDRQLFSLDRPMPDYAEQLEKRIGQATCSEKLTKPLLDKFKAKLKGSQTILQKDLGFKIATIGDSHSTSFAPAGSAVLRTNGLTLFGALSRGDFAKELSSFKRKPKHVTLVAGSIDLRHHIGRMPDAFRAVEELTDKYGAVTEFLKGEFGITLELAAPVPVEYEARKLPKTGYYKDEPFSGSFEKRRQWTKYFIELLECENNVVMPPKEWYEMDGEEFAKENMELGSSVHLAPTKYRRNNWGQA